MEDTKLPSDWKMVPVEPTEEMVMAPGALRTDGQVARIHREIWSRMLEAAPAPVQQAAPSESIGSVRDYANFREDLERLSEPGLSKKQARVIRRAIYDTIDARVRNYAARAAATAQPAGLSDERIGQIASKIGMGTTRYELDPDDYCLRFARTILAASPAGLSEQEKLDAARYRWLESVNFNIEFFDCSEGNPVIATSFEYYGPVANFVAWVRRRIDDEILAAKEAP
ncbi:hypothetical protein [Massilia sp. CCM 8734]|uniref:hypothetical protein n=1 Tax=Massilia sp. CCM 8734 TaxID=2609283 RepID=UPI00141DBBF0|nr:hypothetical protein [Massilia sp. CCM 8734]NHZ94620.1 hypothetical protein [Massilia sp. CCM 8734]